MQCKIFSRDKATEVQEEVNNFLSSDHYKIIKILQSESYYDYNWSLTITIFYE